jgi:hypothetical protein
MSKSKTVQVPAHSNLQDATGEDVPFYDDSKPLPPPLPLKGGSTTARLVPSGSPTRQMKTGEIPLAAAGTKIIHDATIQGERVGAGGQKFTPQRVGNAMKGFYTRPNWIWALGGVVGLGALWLARRGRSERKSGIEIERDEIRQAAYEKLRREKLASGDRVAHSTSLPTSHAQVVLSDAVHNDVAVDLEAAVRRFKEKSERDAILLAGK